MLITKLEKSKYFSKKDEKGEKKTKKQNKGHLFIDYTRLRGHRFSIGY